MAQSFNKSKKSGPKYRISFLFISFVIVFIICFAIYLINGELTDVKNNTDILTAEENETSESEQSETTEAIETTETSEETTTATEMPIQNESGVNPVPLCESKGMSYFSDCAFVGDSVTSGLSSYGFIPASQVYAEVGMNLIYLSSHKLSTIYGSVTVVDALGQLKPNKVYIMIGTNDIGNYSNEKLIGKYTEFINSVKDVLPNASIYAISVPPVTSFAKNYLGKQMLNSDIDEFNVELLKMANEMKIHYVDLNSELKNDEGMLDKEKAANDGFHFQKPTYQIMLDYLMTHVAQ